MKHLLLFALVSALPLCLFSQTHNKANNYTISFHNLNAQNFDQIKDLLSRVTLASEVTFNNSDSTFKVVTNKELDKNIISGKMLKNFFPVNQFIKDGDKPEPFPIFENTGDREKDAERYQQQKSDWIKKYPTEYKKMLESNNK